MKKLFEKRETLCVVALIVLYVVTNAVGGEFFETTQLGMGLLNTLLSVGLLALVGALGKWREYGLVGIKNCRAYLWFLPLLPIATVNLWGGIHPDRSPSEILCHILTMVNVGFLEELIFRGFLFRMMEKSGLKSAIAVSSLTFGMGHIINLLGGAELLPTLLQIGYATAVGFLFVMIFYKSGSILPCILVHIAVNATSVLAVENDMISYVTAAATVVISAGYGIYIAKVRPGAENN